MGINIQKINMNSEAEMIEYLHLFPPAKTILIGNESEVKNNVCVYRILERGNVLMVIGLITEGHGLLPECLYVEGKVVVGYNYQVCIIDGHKVSRIRANSLFYSFLNSKNKNKIIAIFELDVICFSINGEKKWTYSAPDIITDYYIKGSSLCIETDYGKKEITI